MTPLPPAPANDSAAWRSLLLIPLAALFVVHPLAIHGCSCGHDFDFHLVSWMEAARQFSQGNLHPHWATSPAFNAGEPRFVFYPPLSWVLGALLSLLLTHLPGVSLVAGWSATPIFFTWIALTLSGLALYRLARAFAGKNAALLAGVLYLANPYMLFTAYERTAYGELLAAAWIPLLLLAILRTRITIPGIAGPIALLWLTNPPAAIMGSYSLALLAAVRIVQELWATRRGAALQIAAKTAAGFVLGVTLAAFYVVPTGYERRFVQISLAIADGASIGQNFLFGHTGTSSDDLLHDAVLHTASLIAVLLLVATAVALAAVLMQRKSGPSVGRTDAKIHGELRITETTATAFPALPLILLTAGIALLLSPLSAPIWIHAPEATFLQFPWRLLAILTPVFALAVAVALSHLSLRFMTTAIAAMVLVAALTIPAYRVFRQQCYPEDTVSAQLAQFQSQAGTDPTDEYTAVGANNDVLGQSDPPYWLASAPATAAPVGSVPNPTPIHLSVIAPQPEFIILNLRNYSAWRVFLNGSLDPARSHRDDGLIAFPIPAGVSIIDIRYAHTDDQTLGDTISVLAFLVLLGLLTMRRLRYAAGEEFTH